MDEKQPREIPLLLSPLPPPKKKKRAGPSQSASCQPDRPTLFAIRMGAQAPKSVSAQRSVASTRPRSPPYPSKFTFTEACSGTPWPVSRALKTRAEQMAGLPGTWAALSLEQSTAASGCPWDSQSSVCGKPPRLDGMPHLSNCLAHS